MAQTRKRKDVWKLSDWDPILVWYAKAIADLQTRPINEPTSWRYQSAMHDYDRSRDPLAQASDIMPTVAEQKRFWRQCQHGSWFFLPWHRMYLSCFERIIMASVKRLGGPDDWALPYWNYSDGSNPDARRLPPAFRATHLPDGSANSLRIDARAPGANDGDEIADSDDVDISSCEMQPAFVSEPAGGAPGFGGPRTKFMHSGQTAGDLERLPHGSMHMAVGGLSGGWMSSFLTAALDPLFWLHHCNIDRLWKVWLRRDLGHKNPTQAAWLTTIPFELHDADGTIVSMTSSMVIDSTASPLLYEYEDVSDPIGGGLAPLEESLDLTAKEVSIMPEMVGATDNSITLRGEPVSTSLSITAPTGPAAKMEFELAEAPKRVYLNIENITANDVAGSYSVYVNVPPGEDPAAHQELYAGLLPMFGVAEATDTTRDHPANGLQYTLDITDVAQKLQENGSWDPGALRLTFVPKQRGAALRLEESATVADATPVRIGRVSVYFS
jgi:tyrosinase